MVLDPDSIKSQLKTLFSKVDKLEDGATEQRIKVGVLEGQVQDLREDHSDHKGDTEKNSMMLTKIFMFCGAIVTVIGGLAWLYTQAKGFTDIMAFDHIIAVVGALIAISGVFVTIVQVFFIIIINRIFSSINKLEDRQQASVNSIEESINRLHDRIDEEKKLSADYRELDHTECRSTQKNNDDSFHKMKTDLIKISSHVNFPLEA